MVKPSQQSLHACRESDERRKVLQRIIEEDKLGGVPHAPIKPPKPLKRTCSGCGLSKSIFACTEEFMTHQQICGGKLQ